MIFSLAFLTLQDCGPLDAIHAAAKAGYQSIGLRLLPATPNEPAYPLLTDNRLLKNVVAALSETGLQVGDIELVRLGPATQIVAFERFLARAGQLSASHVIVVNDDTDRSRFCENFGALCELAALHGLTVDLEPMPWTATTTLSQAYSCLAEVGQSNAGLLVDALHFHRCGDDLQVLNTIPDRMLNLFQICDAPLRYDPSLEAIQSLSRGARLLPGEGELPLLPLLARLPMRTKISVEVPNLKDSEQFSPEQRAVRGLQATKRIIGMLGSRPPNETCAWVGVDGGFDY
jgi:sugar phosphate isomerase/epimerase